MAAFGFLAIGSWLLAKPKTKTKPKTLPADEAASG
jgi:hypothetical protein